MTVQLRQGFILSTQPVSSTKCYYTLRDCSCVFMCVCARVAGTALLTFV